MKKAIVVLMLAFILIGVRCMAVTLTYEYSFMNDNDKTAFFYMTDPNRSYDYRADIPSNLTDPNDIQDYLNIRIDQYYEEVKLQEYPDRDPNIQNLSELLTCISDPNCNEGQKSEWSMDNPPYNETIAIIDGDSSISPDIKTIFKKVIKILVKNLLFNNV